MLLDRYSPTPYHYAMLKVGHLPPVKCPPLPAPSQTPPPGHLPPLVKAQTKLPMLAAYQYLTVISVSVARCEIRTCSSIGSLVCMNLNQGPRYCSITFWPSKVNGQSQWSENAAIGFFCRSPQTSDLLWLTTKVCKFCGGYTCCSSHCRFLPRIAMQLPRIAMQLPTCGVHPSVRPSVRLYVTFVYFVEMSRRIVRLVHHRVPTPF